MSSFRPTSRQRQIANACSRNAQVLGRSSTVQSLNDGVSNRFDEPRLGQMVAHVAARQSEVAREIVDAFRRGRFSTATTLTRPLLEMCVWISWPFSAKTEYRQRQRLMRLLLQGYREARNRGSVLPPDARLLLQNTRGVAARKPVAFPQMLKDLDETERSTEGGKEFWRSHAASFDWGSQHVHPSLHGPLVGEASGVGIGVSALSAGHQYLALSGAACALAADDTGLKHNIETRYARVATLQQEELAA